MGAGSIAAILFGAATVGYVTGSKKRVDREHAGFCEADVMLKGTRVDGIYTADPEKDPTATRYDRISFEEVYAKGLTVMDMTAFTLCRENKLPIIVFDMNKKGNLGKLINGEALGTIVEF